ncbi:hypothetical protein V3C99_015711 [Haemonchus contortus]|uniref:Uncharacterized protein n=1 Tax=Haemonchus contortus TaxID=6289 RepID=A0A7I4YVW2_HAECO
MLRLRRYDSTPSSNNPRRLRVDSKLQEKELEASYVNQGRLYKGDHILFKVAAGDSNAKIGPRRMAEKLHIGNQEMEWNEQDERLSEFIMSIRIIHGNSQFQKLSHSRTWKPTGEQIYSE